MPAVAELLLNGLTYAEIAGARSVSAETVRSQVGSLFAKTGAKSRGELVRRVLMPNVPLTG